jgi:DNA-binding NarL/FixJ family response regulator
MTGEATNATVPLARVLLVCNVRLYHDAIAALLGGDPHVGLCGHATPNDEILTAYDTTAPDVVLLDTGPAGALDMASQLVRTRPRARVLGFGVYEQPLQVIACAQAGLAGYVPNTASLQDLVAATRQVAQGGTVCSAAMASGLFHHVRGTALRHTPAPVIPPLTVRQQQIARLLADGLSNKEIARRLVLGTSTVKNHVHEILDRLNVSSRAQVAARVQQPENRK